VNWHGGEQPQSSWCIPGETCNPCTLLALWLSSRHRQSWPTLQLLDVAGLAGGLQAHPSQHIFKRCWKAQDGSDS
jgi:hypothetical protein